MFDKKQFAQLLNQAIGERSLNEYARQTGVSSAHISRLARGLLDNPPTPQIIKKFAEFAVNNVTYTDFITAAGYLNFDLKTFDHQPSHISDTNQIVDNRNSVQHELITLICEADLSPEERQDLLALVKIFMKQVEKKKK